MNWKKACMDVFTVDMAAYIIYSGYRLYIIAITSKFSDYNDQSAWTKGLDIWSKSRKNYKHRSIDHNSMVPKEWNESVASQNAYCHCYTGWIDQHSVACFKRWIYTLRFCVSFCRPQHSHGRFHRKIFTRTWKNHLKKMLNDLRINMYQQIQTGIGAICKNFHFQQRMLYS